MAQDIIGGAHSAEVSGKELAALFDDIVLLAGRAERVFYHFDQSDDEEKCELELQHCRAIVERIGWIADLGAKRLGERLLESGAEQWFLTPACQEALRVAKAALAQGAQQ